MSYICSRYYRAPELIFGATDYTVNIGKKLIHTLHSVIPTCTRTVLVDMLMIL